MAFYSTTDYNVPDDMTSPCSDSSSISSEGKKLKKLRDDMKRLDPGYLTIYRKLNRKRTKIELYKTPFSSNCKIRNAVTGYYENCKVGQFKSRLYFKVALCTGEHGQNPAHLYFDSPEQYESHCNIRVSSEIKKVWANAYNLEFENLA